MKRIDTSTKAVDLFGAGKHGFKDGNKALGIAATKLDASLFNNVQEEIVRVIEAAGIALDGAVYNQLLLALRAAGVFTTQAQFDTSTKAATTEFVAQNSGRFVGNATINGAGTMTAATHAGKVIQLSGVGPYTEVLPLASSVPNGTLLKLVCTASGVITISRQGTDQIYPLLNNPVNSFAMTSGDHVLLEQAGGLWAIIDGSVIMNVMPQFGASLAVNGWQKLPSGLFLQWGLSASIGSDGRTTVTFPIAFPNACFSATATPKNDAASGTYTDVSSAHAGAFTNTNMIVHLDSYSTGVNRQINWMAIGN